MKYTKLVLTLVSVVVLNNAVHGASAMPAQAQAAPHQNHSKKTLKGLINYGKDLGVVAQDFDLKAALEEAYGKYLENEKLQAATRYVLASAFEGVSNEMEAKALSGVRAPNALTPPLIKSFSCAVLAYVLNQKIRTEPISA